MRRLARGADAADAGARDAAARRPARRRTCARGLRAALHVRGDEPLLAQEAGDAIRAAARAAGYSERKVFTVARRALRLERPARRGAGAEPVRRPPADRDPHPRGKPGKDGSEALQRYCEHAAPTTCVTLVQLPRLDRQQQSSAWFARARQRRRDAARRPGRAQRRCRSGSRSAWRRRASACRTATPASATLAFFADRVEGNLLAAHQEIQKLALLYPRGRAELRADRGGGAQRRALRRVQARRGGAGRPGRARAAHARRPAGRRRGAGAGALDAGRGHPRAQAREGRGGAGQAAADGAARERASGAPRSACSSARCRCCRDHTLAQLVEAAQRLRRPGQGPEASATGRSTPGTA